MGPTASALKGAGNLICREVVGALLDVLVDSLTHFLVSGPPIFLLVMQSLQPVDRTRVVYPWG